MGPGLDALRSAGCTQIFEEHVSTRSTDRPGLDAVMAILRSGDILAVWKLDRLGRSVKDVLIIADDLHAYGSVFGRPRVITPEMAAEARRVPIRGCGGPRRAHRPVQRGAALLPVPPPGPLRQVQG